jgi:hypothetical protein
VLLKEDTPIFSFLNRNQIRPKLVLLRVLCIEKINNRLMQSQAFHWETVAWILLLSHPEFPAYLRADDAKPFACMPRDSGFRIHIPFL